jgi:hypothetical protein
LSSHRHGIENIKFCHIGFFFFNYRTHPINRISGNSGYLIHGIKVINSFDDNEEMIKIIKDEKKIENKEETKIIEDEIIE